MNKISNEILSIFLDKYKMFAKKIFTKYNRTIERISKVKNVDPELVFLIIVNEQVNRGDFITKILEKLCVYLLPRFALKRDLSIGLGQIKISTAMAICRDTRVAKQLLNDTYNIFYVSKIIKDIEYRLQQDFNIENLIKMYTMGSINKSKVPYNVKIYIKIAEWSYSKRYFKTLKDSRK